MASHDMTLRAVPPFEVRPGHPLGWLVELLISQPAQMAGRISNSSLPCRVLSVIHVDVRGSFPASLGPAGHIRREVITVNRLLSVK